MDNLVSVLHVTFNMGIGGTEQVIRQLINTMDGAAHDIACIEAEVGAIGQLLQSEGVRVDAFRRRPGFDWHLVGKLRNHIRLGGYQIVHCHQYTPYVYGWLAAFGTGAKVVFTEHGRFHPDRYRYKAILINPLVARLTPAIVAISSATRDALARYEFMPRRHIRVIYNGIRPLSSDPEATRKVRKDLGITDDAFVFGTVSRLDPVKNQVMMLRAFARLLSDCPDAWLLIVGDGPEREKLERLSVELGIADRTIFTGFINAPQAHLGAMDVFLLSSFTEGTSMTLLEAMSLSIPTVATHVGGNPEIAVDNETGLMVSSDDVEGFSRAMARLYGDQALRVRLGGNARERFDANFSAKVMADSYLSCYSSLLKAGR